MWGVEIDEASYERARTFLENPPAPRPNPDMPWYFEEAGKKYYSLTGQSQCVFLDKDKQCYLHAHDPMLKSSICRNYPKSGVTTPRGFEMGMSFSSFGAFLNVLAHPEPFGLTETQIELNPAGATYPPTPVTRPQPYGWETYFQIETILLDFIGRMGSLDDALIASARFLTAVEQEPDGPNLRRDLETRRIHPLTFMEQRPISNLEASYNLVERILTFRAAFMKDAPLLQPCRESIQSMLDDMDRGLAEEKIGRALFYKRLMQSYYDPNAAALLPVLRKFVQYKIFQKTFFFEFGFARGFNILCFFHALIRLRLAIRARQARRERSSPAVADLFDPVHFAELHFAHSGKFLQFWNHVFQSNLLTPGALSEILVRT